MKKNTIKSLLFACFIPALAISCDKENPTPPNPEEAGKPYFISVTGQSAEYIIMTDDLSSGSLRISDNIQQLEMSGYTWVFGGSPKSAIGLIYAQGDPGIGLGYTITDGQLDKLGEFQIASRFTTYGFFGKYAITGVSGQVPLDANGNSLKNEDGTERTDGATFNFIDLDNDLAIGQKYTTTKNITGNGDQATFAGIVDIGNGEFLAGLVVSQPKDPSQGGGASSGPITYPDSVWVAALDANLNLKRIYRSDKLSYSAGRRSSQYYSQIGKADDGTVYVFSGSFDATTTKPAGALKINKNATTFDDSYYFNIEEANGGYRFRKVWHISEDYFLLECYNETGTVASSSVATQYAVVDMSAKSFKWVTGIPAQDEITGIGTPTGHAGKAYFPILAEGSDPVIYVIDPAAAIGTKGLTITGATAINAIGYLGN